MTGADAIAGVVQVVGACSSRRSSRADAVGEGAPAGPSRRLAAAALPRARAALAQVGRRSGRARVRSTALAPAIVAASLALAWLLVPIAGRAPDWPVGHDALVLLGLLALARFALAAAAWDTGNGFALQGASRDLAIGVAVEAVL